MQIEVGPSQFNQFIMKSPTATALSLATGALALNCSPSAIAPLLPSNARLAFATQVAQGGTFNVPASDIAYPVSPTNLSSLCAIQVNVTSSNSSAYSFGLFLPQDWNERFLAVGNGGFAGGTFRLVSVLIQH